MLSILSGIFIFLVAALIWLSAVYAVLFGILWLTLGFHRNHPIHLVRPAWDPSVLVP